MTELIRLIVEIISGLWPLRKVDQWERGVVYLRGRYWSTWGPGIWPIIPYLMDLVPVSVVPSIHGTPLQTVTLRDKRQLTFSATVTIQVEDPAKALNNVEQWSETVVELVAGILAERLADIDPERFDPDRKKRERLLESLRAELDAASSPFGVRVRALRLNNFAIGIRTFRLLTENATLKELARAPGAQQGGLNA